MLNPDDCWASLLRREGGFLVGVITTGVYCRTACAARRPLRQNVRFFETVAAAEAAGLRACLRCRPNAEPVESKIRELCTFIEEHSDQPWTLAGLAKRVEMSPFTLQRRFQAVAGVTPKHFLEACRLRRLKQHLRSDEDVTGAVYHAGYGSASRVYERADTHLGMTPGQYRAEAAGLEISYAGIQSPLGLVLVGATDRGLCFVQFGETEGALVEALRREYPRAALKAMSAVPDPQFEAWVAALAAHLRDLVRPAELPVDVRATAFQMRVWNYLRAIPVGQVRSYTQVAEALGQPRAARAVARACATNVVAVVIPCHRVIRGTGALGGYRWGLERKQALLEGEGQALAASSPSGVSKTRIEGNG